MGMTTAPFLIPDPTDPVWPALDRYVADQADEADRALVTAWCDAEAERRGVLGRWCEAWRELQASTNADVATADIITNQILARTTNEHSRRAQLPGVSRTHGWRGYIPRRMAIIGASIATIGVCAIAVLQTGFGSLGHSHTQQFATAAGERLTVRLNDGSRVILAPATHIVVASTTDARIVHVVGEAYFTVTSQDRRPFEVRAGSGVAHVLGTAFGVRRYADDRAAQIYVVDGRVAVGHVRLSRDRVVASAGAVATVTDSNTVVVTRNVSTEVLTAWTRSELVYQETPLSEVVNSLSRAYGIQLRIADSTMARRRVTLTVSLATTSLTDVLEALMPGLGAHYTQNRSGVTIFAGRRADRRTPANSTFSPEIAHGR
jgi:transmembrane sensor